MVAQLRAAYGHHVGDPAWTGFIRRMEAGSPEFAAMWATQDVAHPHYYAKVFRHPLYPRLEMTSTSFAVQTAPGTRMVVYTPDNQATRVAMERLVADPVQHHFPCWPAHQARAAISCQLRARCKSNRIEVVQAAENVLWAFKITLSHHFWRPLCELAADVLRSIML